MGWSEHDSSLLAEASATGLTASPFSTMLINAAQTGHIALSDGSKLSPLDLFWPSFTSGRKCKDVEMGVAMVIVNCLPVDLVLEKWGCWDYTDVPGLHAHPASPIWDSTKNVNLSPHVIPARRAFPKPSKHKNMLAGFGMYFWGPTDSHSNSIQLALSLSATDNGKKGPLLGVSVNHQRAYPAFKAPTDTVCSAVTADVNGKYGSLQAFHEQTTYKGVGLQYEIGPAPGYTIWGTFHGPSLTSVSPLASVITVWIRDNAWDWSW